MNSAGLPLSNWQVFVPGPGTRIGPSGVGFRLASSGEFTYTLGLYNSNIIIIIISIITIMMIIYRHTINIHIYIYIQKQRLEDSEDKLCSCITWI